MENEIKEPQLLESLLQGRLGACADFTKQKTSPRATSFISFF